MDVYSLWGRFEEDRDVKYLGQLVVYDDNDSKAMQLMKKACKGWAQESRVLRAENASPKVCCVFYKGTVQAVLLFGNKA